MTNFMYLIFYHDTNITLIYVSGTEFLVNLAIQALFSPNFP